jgi:hypothetical protein
MTGPKLPRRKAFSLALIGSVVAALMLGPLALTASAATADSAGRGSAPLSSGRAGTDPASSPALADLKTCLAQKKRGDLVLLIDTSASLAVGDDQAPASDPSAVRVDAATLLLTRLSESLEKNQIALDVAVAGFDADVTTVVDFTPLTKNQMPSLEAQVAGFADKDTGTETDYWNALTWVNQTLQAKQQSRGDLPACQLAIWFTDGEFSLSATGAIEQPPVPGYESTVLSDGETASAVQAAAAKELCRAAGPADQMRLAGTTFIAVGLGDQAAGYNQENFSLENYAENPSLNCGAQPGRGLFIPAPSVSELVLGFDALVGDDPVRPNPKQLCPLAVCAEGSYPITLDDSLDVVHVAAVLDNQGKPITTAGIAVQLTSATGQSLVISSDGQPRTDSGTVDGATVDFQWYPRGALTLDLRHPPAQSWAGDWKLTFIDTDGQHADALSRIQLTLTSDLQLIPEVAQTPWRAGQQSGEITFRPARLDGTPVDPASLVTSGWTEEASLVFDQPATDEGTTPLTVPVDLSKPIAVAIPEILHPGTWHLLVKLGVSMAGKPLPKIGRQVDVEILPPFGSPTLAPPDQTLDFGQIEGTSSVSRTVSVTGPSDGDGCVWVTQGSLGVTPSSVDDVSIGSGSSDAAGCLTVGAQQTAEVALSLTPDSAGNGDLAGQVDVHLAPASDTAKASVSTVDYHAVLIRPPNQPVKWIVLLAVMLLGIGIPVLALIIARRWVARFPQNALLQYTLVDVQVGPSGLRGPGGLTLDAAKLSWTSIGAPTRSGHELALGPITLRATAGWQFTEPGYAEIDSGDLVGVCGNPPHRNPRSGRALLPLAVQGTWTLLFHLAAAASSLPTISGQMLVIVATGMSNEERLRLVGAAGRDAPELVDGLRRDAAAGAPSEPQEPGDPVLVGTAGGNPFEGAADQGTGFGLGGAGFVETTSTGSGSGSTTARTDGGFGFGDAQGSGFGGFGQPESTQQETGGRQSFGSGGFGSGAPPGKPDENPGTDSGRPFR